MSQQRRMELGSGHRKSAISDMPCSAKPMIGARCRSVCATARRVFRKTPLPEAESKRWLPQLELVELPLGQVLYESGATLSHVYFPTTAIVSLLYVMENGASAEIAVVGYEGLVGISLFMGGGSTPSLAVVQSAGRGFLVKAQVVKDG